jgi:ComF family protein
MINLLNLFFPKVCEACSSYLSDNEQIICTLCRHALPVTNFHRTNNDSVKKILYGRVRLEYATALLYFSKGGKVQKMIHNLKYRGHEHISLFLGEWLGSELNESNQFKLIDAVVPVPLHPSRKRQRGFNQVHQFGRAIAKALDRPFVTDLLIKQSASKTQVFKSRFMRYDDTGSQFMITDDRSWSSKHLLLVDDLITTGATIEQCAQALNQIEDLKLSLATMAIAE